MPYIVDWHCLPGDASYGNNWQAPPKRKRSPSLSTGTQWSLRQHFDRGCICTLWARTRWHQAIQLWPTSRRKLSSRYPDPDAGHGFLSAFFGCKHTSITNTKREKINQNGLDKRTKYKTAVRYLEALS